MVGFNLLEFGQGTQAGGITEGLVRAFGLPSCILEIDEALIVLLPTPILILINTVLEEFQAQVDAAYKWISGKLADIFGLEQYFTEEGIAKLRDKLGLSDVVGVLAKMQALINIGMDAYAAITNIIDFIEEVRECIEEVIAALSKKNGTSADGFTGEQLNAQLGLAEAQLSQLQNLDERITNLSTLIGSELYERSRDPNRGPKIKREYESLLGPTFQYADEDEDEELIRLVYGPPISKDGQYILSVDGLYYDSQSEDGVFPVLIQLRDRERLLNNADKWKFNFDPNLGGRGEEVNERTFNKWLGSIFDLNIIDDSEELEQHYSSDSFLQNLIGQRDKRMLDLKEQVDQLISVGESNAVINNFKQSLVSETSQLDTKVARRKKQIEIAVKAPAIFGMTEAFLPGTVPINDFSYLQKYNITAALPQQENLVINTESVSGVVKPLSAKFVRTKNPNTGLAIEPLMIPSIGYDAIITDTSSVYDTTSAPTLNIEEMISTDGLFALYNFLNSDVVLPDSTEFNLPNCYDYEETNNGQLIAKTSKEFFDTLGLAAPYFKGITRYVNGKPQNLGAFARMPDTLEFQDWTYNKSKGFGFETWLHMPSIEDSVNGWSDNGASGLYRLILANENTGKAQQAIRDESYNLVPYENGTNYTKGMIFGFTTDIRWTQRQLPSNDKELQDVSNGYGLVLAPTLGYDGSSATFIATPECDGTNGWLGMYIPATKQTSSGKTLKDCRTEYMLLSFGVDYKSDTVTVFLDGEVLETSSVVDVFGSTKNQPINIPSFYKPNSFQYSERDVGSQASRLLKSGPKLGKFFTPWILGGGYTDGNKNGGFMGGAYGGLISGLRGFLGSVKFYSKSLSVSEVKKNYDIQSKLFKTIRVKPVSVIIALGQSNMDGEFTAAPGQGKLYSSNAGKEVRYNVDRSYIGAMKDTYIWTPSAVDSSAGRWQELDLINPFEEPFEAEQGVVQADPLILSSLTPYKNTVGTFGDYPTSLSGYGGLNASRYFIGQAAGRFIDYELNPATIYDPASNVTLQTTGVQVLRHFDPITPFMERLKAFDNQEVYLIKNAKNSLAMVSGLTIDDSILSFTDNRHPGTNVQGSGIYFTLKHDLSGAIDALNAKYTAKEYEIKAVVLLQGEFETLYTSAVQPNYPNLDQGEMADKWGYYFSSILYPTFQTDIKAMLGKPDMPDVPWLIGRTHIEMAQPLPPGGIQYTDNGKAFFVDRVRAQQEAVANLPEINAYIVDIDGTTGGFTDQGKVHFLAEGLRQVGLRFFDKYKEVIGF